MFDSYDNYEKAYEIIFPDKTVVKYTTQELYEFFMFSDASIGGDFADLKNKLDSGIAVTGDHMEWDWNLGTNNYKGRLIITRITPPKILPQTKNKTKVCDHKNTYVNSAGGKKFRFCKDCKSDLGDVE